MGRFVTYDSSSASVSASNEYTLVSVTGEGERGRNKDKKKRQNDTKTKNYCICTRMVITTITIIIIKSSVIMKDKLNIITAWYSRPSSYNSTAHVHMYMDIHVLYMYNVYIGYNAGKVTYMYVYNVECTL